MINNHKTHYIVKYILIPLVVLVVFLYIAYANIKPFGGSIVEKIDVGKNDRLAPLNRVTGSAIDINGTTYKELEHNLVYFDVDRTQKADKIKIRVRFKDNFPVGGIFKIGAKDEEEWHYLLKTIYSKPNNNFTLIQDEEWLIGGTTFDVENLYLKNDKYNFLLNLDHLSKDKTKNMTIPIDWIEIEYNIPPLIRWTKRN